LEFRSKVTASVVVTRYFFISSSSKHRQKCGIR
jgi:hypothetical protein